MGMLVENVKTCKAKGQYGHVNKALELLGKSMDLFRDSIPLEAHNTVLRLMAEAVMKYISDEPYNRQVSHIY
jgi:hypothetical protein